MALVAEVERLSPTPHLSLTCGIYAVIMGLLRELLIVLAVCLLLAVAYWLVVGGLMSMLSS